LTPKASLLYKKSKLYQDRLRKRKLVRKKLRDIIELTDTLPFKKLLDADEATFNFLMSQLKSKIRFWHCPFLRVAGNATNCTEGFLHCHLLPLYRDSSAACP